MRILYIAPFYYPNLIGGSERSLKLIAEEMAKHDKEVHVISFDGDKTEVINEVVVHRVKRVNLPVNTIAQNISLMLNSDLIDDIEPDIIHVYNTYHIPSISFLRRRCPVVATLNNYYPIIATGYTKDNIIETGNINLWRVMISIIKTDEGNLFVRIPRGFFYAIYSKIVRSYCKKIDGYIVYANAIKEIYVNCGFDSDKINVIRSPMEKFNESY